MDGSQCRCAVHGDVNVLLLMALKASDTYQGRRIAERILYHMLRRAVRYSN